MFRIYSPKVNFLLIGLMFNVYSPNAQNLPTYDRKQLHFGITMGINRSAFKLYKHISFIDSVTNPMDSINSIESASGMGFNLGIISDLRINSHLNLRFIPALSFAERGVYYEMGTGINKTKKIESTYLDFPLQLKFKSDRIKDFRLYTFLGSKYSIDMISNAKARNAVGRLKTKKHIFFIEYGMGTDFYFEYFKFSIELKFSNGLNDILVYEPEYLYSSVLDRLFPKTFLFSLHFE